MVLLQKMQNIDLFCGVEPPRPGAQKKAPSIDGAGNNLVRI